MHKYGLIIAVVVAIIVVYYVISPYQNCMRDEGNKKNHRACAHLTSW